MSIGECIGCILFYYKGFVLKVLFSNCQCHAMCISRNEYLGMVGKDEDA